MAKFASNSGGGVNSPSGTAGGDLSGAYPNPAVAKVQGDANVAFTDVANVFSAEQTINGATGAWAVNAVGGGAAGYGLQATGVGAGVALQVVQASGSAAAMVVYGNVNNDLVDFYPSGGGIVKINQLGLIFPVQAANASPPAYVKGAMYFDTTLNKLRIGGAAGWETVTSV